MRKTKIVCTIGPASEDIATLKSLVDAGMNVARMNFSHGDHEEHRGRIESIREVSHEKGDTVAILLDTKGPEIRTGVLKEEAIELVEGETIVLTGEEIEGDKEKISLTYDGLADDIQPGNTVLVDDGLIELKCEQVEGRDVVCRILNGGELKSRKGVNLPGVKVQLPGITDKDARDIEFGIQQNVDFIAASFVRKAHDILEIREILENHDADIDIIAKIENQEGVDNLEEILQVSDGVMVARGDLGVEIPAEEVPLVQKRMIERCNVYGKPVITATQMLDSMQRNPRPTRAEASDVANAIFDGTDAIMLSGETAAGKYPLESVSTMHDIAVRTEEALSYKENLQNVVREQRVTVTNAISQAVANAALDLNATAVVTATESGHTGRMVSKYRPKAPIIAVTPHADVQRKLALIWGIYPILAREADTTDEMLDISVDKAVQTGIVQYGDLIVISAGVPVRETGTTNLMKVHIVGDVVGKGQGIGSDVVTGNVVVGTSAAELARKMEEGDVMVTNATDRDMMASFEKAKAAIVEEGGLTSHAAVVGLNLGIPVVVGVKEATSVLKDDMQVTVDPARGHIYSGSAKVL